MNQTKNYPNSLEKSETGDGYIFTNKESNIIIKCKKYKFGKDLVFGNNISICSHDGGFMEYLEIGDNTKIDYDSRILVLSFTVGDYTKINNKFFAYGSNKLTIGHNCWIGANVILDSLGGLEVEDNVCINSHSQVYSHAEFGDTSYGCRINKRQKVHIKKDCWIAANCQITMASMSEKSMLLGNGILTEDTSPNRIYAGVPAKDITKKTGPQFDSPTVDEIKLRVEDHLYNFESLHPEYRGHIRIILRRDEITEGSVTFFVVQDRKYTKIRTDAEIAFMLYLQSNKAKFTPY